MCCYTMLTLNWKCTNNCKYAAVHTIQGIKVFGLYHHMEAGPHARVVAAISAHTQWGGDCSANNVSSGKLFVVTASGAGKLDMVHTPMV